MNITITIPANSNGEYRYQDLQIAMALALLGDPSQTAIISAANEITFTLNDDACRNLYARLEEDDLTGMEE